MTIDSIEISNFGVFQNKEISFSTEEINIIQGANGSGKTMLLTLLYSIFQDDEKLEYVSEGETAHIILKLKENEETICIEKNYKNSGAEIVVSSISEMKKITSLNFNNIYIFSGEFLDYDYIFNSVMIRNAKDLLRKVGCEDNTVYELQLDHARKFRYISAGMQFMIRILNMLYYIPSNSVLLIDAPFSKLDVNMIKFLSTVMKKLSNVQIILTANMAESEMLHGNKIYLERNSDYRLPNYFRYTRKTIFSNDMKYLIHTLGDKNELKLKKQEPEIQIVKYVLDTEVEDIENRNIEYKEIKGNNPCKSIVDVSEIYINAFLNSRVTRIGVLKWGITDDGIVKGVLLSKKDRDIIDRKLSERLGQMTPYVSADILEIVYENIMDGQTIAQDLYVIEIIVKPWTSDILFSTSKGDVYIKTEGGKQKLDAQGIQNELKSRLRYYEV